MAIVSHNKLYFYKYNLKHAKEAPELIKEFDIKPDARFTNFPKYSLFGIFYDK